MLVGEAGRRQEQCFVLYVRSETGLGVQQGFVLGLGSEAGADVPSEGEES